MCVQVIFRGQGAIYRSNSDVRIYFRYGFSGKNVHLFICSQTSWEASLLPESMRQHLLGTYRKLEFTYFRLSRGVLESSFAEMIKRHHYMGLFKLQLVFRTSIRQTSVGVGAALGWQSACLTCVKSWADSLAMHTDTCFVMMTNEATHKKIQLCYGPANPAPWRLGQEDHQLQGQPETQVIELHTRIPQNMYIPHTDVHTTYYTYTHITHIRIAYTLIYTTHMHTHLHIHTTHRHTIHIYAHTCHMHTHTHTTP